MLWVLLSLNNMSQRNAILVIAVQMQSFLYTEILFAWFEPTAVFVQAMIDLKVNMVHY